MKKEIPTLLMLLLTALSARADVVLNEVVSQNDFNGFAAADGGFHDWIEFYNTGDEAIDLKDYYLTDDPDDLQKWDFDQSFVIEPGGYAVVFASDLDDLIEGQEHLNFKLNGGDGEYLALVKGDEGTIISEFSPKIPPLPRLISYGRLADGSNGILDSPTPGEANSEAAALPEILSFTASKEVLEQRESVTLTWETQNGMWVTLNTGSGQERMLEAADSVILRPVFDTKYILEVRNKFGTVQQEITVAVGPLVSDFTATPDVIATGGQTILRWTLEGNNEVISLDGQAVDQYRSPFAFTPTNVDLISNNAVWKTAPEIPGDGWKELNFDDSTWLNRQAPLTRKAFHRLKFEVSDPATLASVFLFPNEIPNYELTLNGVVIAEKLRSFGAWNHLVKSLRIDPSLLVEGTNILAIETQNDRSALDLSLSAWRAQPVDTIVPVTLTTRNPAGESSKTINVTVLAAETELPPLPPLVISELYWAYAGTMPMGPFRFFEVHNCSEDEIDLTGIQFFGSLNFDFSDATETTLDARGHALVVNHHPTFSEVWPGERPVLGQFEDALVSNPYVFEMVVGLLDPFGRMIEAVNSGDLPPVQNAFQPIQRVDCGEPSDEETNWFINGEDYNAQGRGTPGEASFRIIDFRFDPPFASPGETVTLHWEVSREGNLEILDGIGPVSGPVGEMELIVPADARSFRFRLHAQSQFSSLDSLAVLILPPSLGTFGSDKTAITPGEEVTLRWNQNIPYGTAQTTIAPEFPQQVYGSTATFTPLIGGFPKGSSWRTFTHPLGPEPNWTSPEYENPWRFRTAVIGVGDDRVKNELTSPPALTVYFQRTFRLTEIEEINGLFLDLLNDGGIEVHLNGTEVLRDNLPEGPIDHVTPALNELLAVERTFEIDPALLVEGENTIAIGLHNESEVDPTIVFDLGLRAQRPIPESGRKVYTLTSSNDAGSTSSQIMLLFQESIQVEDWQTTNGLIGNAASQDEDGDGLSDLMEFATGSNPLEKSPHPIRFKTDENGHLILSHSQNLAAGGVDLIVEASDDLATWRKLHDFVFESSLAPENSDIAEVRYRSYSPTTDSRYFRLRAQ